VSEKTERKAKPLRVVVTSDKMQKSRTGVVNRLVKHADYDKYIRRRTKVMFHDEDNQSKIGDEVLVSQTRPLSKNKKFTLLQIVRKAAE
jgi:small subunit ribosomal protein S17